MPLWKWLLLNVYYHASQPARWWIYRKLAAQRRMPITLLYYHRVADDGATPWTMPNRTFIDQMRWLRRNFELISMEEVQRRLRSGVNDRPAVHVTFDDGYADNCQTAIPAGQRADPLHLLRHRAEHPGVPAVRPRSEARLSLVPNSLEEIRAMADAGIEIGAHTYSHADLGKLTDPAVLHKELVVARQELAGDRPAGPLFRFSLRSARQPESPGLRPGRPVRL